MRSESNITPVEEKFDRLQAICQASFGDEDLRELKRAYEYIRDTFRSATTDANELIKDHVVSVATVAVEEMGLGMTAVVASLLHDTILKGFADEREIRKEFGDNVTALVLGFSRISELPTQKVAIQSESFRKLFLALVDDIRVILIKMAHRLDDMRHINMLPREKQVRFHNEVVHLYSPIAHRLGLYRIKKELEDLSMKYTQPEIYRRIEQKIRETEDKRNAFIHKFIEPIEKEILKQEINFQIIGRSKSIPSIWNKMQHQEVEFEQIFDLFAIRIITDSSPENEKADCWKVYSIVTNIYQPNPKRLRDWISTPKASGYESLHTTVKGPSNRWVEVQIRSSRMDEVAEKGQAAHWKYKGFGSRKDTEEWLNQVRDIIEHPEQINFEENEISRIEKSHDKVYVFTPNGDLRELQAGATVLDFAFEIHSNVGYSCTGAKVNNKIVPLKQPLGNGDKVEILTSKMQKPKMDWLGYVVTTKAKTRIKRALKEEKFKESEKGNEILRRKFRNWKITFNDENIDKLIKKYKLGSSVDLYTMIYQEKLDLLDIKKFFTADSRKKGAENVETREKIQEPRSDSATAMPVGEVLMIDRNLDKVNYKLAKCCNPIPGDVVFGFVTISRGITIHRKNCPNAKQLLSRYGYRKIAVQWKDTAEVSFQARLRISGLDKIGILNEISQVISSDLKANMLSLKVDVKNGIFTGDIKVMVRTTKHLDELLNKIAKIRGVTKAQRID